MPSATEMAKTDSFKKTYATIKNAITSSGAGKILQDMYTARKPIFISIAMAIVYSLAFIYLLSGFAECIAWFCVILTQLGLIAGAVMSGFLYVDA